MKRSPTLCTGCSSRRILAVAAAAATLLGFPPGTSQAQSLKLRAIPIPSGVQPGAWVSYQVKIQTQNRSTREFLQRLAVVASEGTGEEAGVWVELKTVEAGKTRIERGFFGQNPGGEGETENARPARRTRVSPTKGALKVLRYQLLTPDGKLVEYPVRSQGAPRLDEDLSAISLFEFLPEQPANRDSLGPDTLRIGRKVVPCVVRRVRRYGAEDWSDDDTSFVNRALLTRLHWTNPAIPVTGYAKSILEISSERVRVGSGTSAAPDSATAHAADSTAARAAGSTTAARVPDSTTVANAAVSTPAAHAADSTASPGALGTSPLAQGNSPSGARLFYRAEVTLLDLGTGAVPEVTQEAEPAPTPPPDTEEAEPRRPGRVLK